MLTFAFMLTFAASTDDAWGEAQGGLATRLTLVTKEPAVGNPLKVKLEIKNVGATPAEYDDQQAMVNNPVSIKGPDGKLVPYIGMNTQTMGSKKSLNAGADQTIFHELDLTGQYLLDKPGKYTIAYKAQYIGGIPSSNELTINLKEGKLSDYTRLVSAFLKNVPQGWRVASYGNEISLINSPTNLKADVAIITIYFTKEDKTDRENTKSLGKTRLGHAWVEVSPSTASDRWPENKKFVEDQLKAFRE